MAATVEEKSLLGPGNVLSVSKITNEKRLTVILGMKTTGDCILHWGLNRRSGSPWRVPPNNCWPAGTMAAAGNAVRTPFTPSDHGDREVKINIDLPCPWSNLSFVLHFPKENRWLKSGAQDFTIQLPNRHPASNPENVLSNWVGEVGGISKIFPLDSGDLLATKIVHSSEGIRIYLVCDAEAPLFLHWGLAEQFRHEWKLPSDLLRPPGTVLADQKAARTPFGEREGVQILELAFPKPATGKGPRGLRFVLFQSETASWLKSGAQEMYLPLFETDLDPRLPFPKLLDLAEVIVGVEKGPSSWSLMHRFNLCHDLLEKVQDDEEGLALLFTWLRFSATRQLDWQRNYNTKPRELSHAQDRLTQRLASVWRRHPKGSECGLWVRRLLINLGRGGDGQRVRDEILHIMHRNHLKETRGLFVEEWHQKLHNNTTPDDIIICQAYLAFLNSNGDRNQFDKTLKDGGVSRERLRSFERPIRTDPEFYPDKKDGLVRDFDNFLHILKSVHSGTDLDCAAATARSFLSGELAQKLDSFLWLRRGNPSPKDLGISLISVREGLNAAIASSGNDGVVRDLLYLDLALEEVLRGKIESQNLSKLGRDELVELVHIALRNLQISPGSAELAVCGNHWEALKNLNREGRELALHAKSVADRAARWIQGFTDNLYQRLQPKAEFLGSAFEVEPWTIPLFSEEVVRGGPAFGLALLLRHLDPILRKAAGLGGWQVISPFQVAGIVRIVERLVGVQGERFPEATVLIADNVAGNEEIPEGVTAVLTKDSPDLVSHVAVRARNVGVLLATCFDPEIYLALKGLKDCGVALRVTPGGDVEWEEGNGQEESGSFSWKRGGLLSPIGAPPFSSWVATEDQFTSLTVGGKSNNLNGLRGRLPDWIHLPKSLALPFGVFEKTLEDAVNKHIQGQYANLVKTINLNTREVLSHLRTLVREMNIPAPLQQALQESWQKGNLPVLHWEQVWKTIRKVWASKWNERAYHSRRARAIDHASLRMAVLIQQVVEADYAFVIHTVNPITGNKDEVFAEVVLGLGETLVGNFPGRALGFVCPKGAMQPEVLSFPSKSLGLYGRGLIFRSDSNGEDLEGFAGAGLYDSFLAEEPEHRLLDYRNEKLVWNLDFRNGLLQAIARIGQEVERVLGSPQDIEGAVMGDKFYIVQTRPQVGLKDH